MFAEERTTTDVIGKPPNNPLTMFPIPCAFNSRLVSVNLLYVSNLSVASIHNNVSIEATTAIVTATIHTFSLVNAAKFGKAKPLLISVKDGKLTK